MRHPVLLFVLTTTIVTILLFGAAEAILRQFPFATVSIGWASSEKGRRYGWGFDPDELQAVRDADTGELYFNRANHGGWRDLPREHAKPPGVFRVLVLGDSNIYGHVVAADQTATRHLEGLLRGAGVRAEVINMAYSGWGTDQQLEALRNEGMRHQPDVVVLHFCPNDLNENFHWRVPGKFGSRRPFYYELDPEGRLMRGPNPNYRLPTGTWMKEFLLRHVELAKRVYMGWNIFLALRKPTYSLSPGQVAMIGYDLGLPPDAPLLQSLRTLIERKDLEREELAGVFARHGYGSHSEVLLRMSERVNDQENDPRDSYFVHSKGLDEWPLFHALVREMRNVAESGGAKLLISTDLDEGKWEWERYWHRVQPSAEARSRYLERNELLRRFAQESRIGFVEPTHAVERARNDVHPNARGNAAIARNVFEYLLDAGLLPRPARPAG